MMLHGVALSIEKVKRADGSYMYQPKSPLKRFRPPEFFSFCIRLPIITLDDDQDA
jgi:hypothetical protein